MPKDLRWRCPEGLIGIFVGGAELIPKARPAGLSVVNSQTDL